MTGEGDAIPRNPNGRRRFHLLQVQVGIPDATTMTAFAFGADLSGEGTEDSSPAAPAQNDRGGGCHSEASVLCGGRHLHLLQVQVGIPDTTRSGPSSRSGPPHLSHRDAEGPARAIGGASG